MAIRLIVLSQLAMASQTTQSAMLLAKQKIALCLGFKKIRALALALI